MSPIILLLLFIVSNCNSLSIGVRENNVTKRQANGDFFPNWVPFKNKHGEELGEFIDVPKPKPKKRLAPPMNFMLKADADEDNDYYNQGESDNEDYYEKKQWSDINRPEVVVNSRNLSLSDIAGIDNIVKIITKPGENHLLRPTSLRFSRTEKKERENFENSDDYSDKDDTSESVSQKEQKNIGVHEQKDINNDKKEKVYNHDYKEEKDDDYGDDDDDEEEKEIVGAPKKKAMVNESFKYSQDNVNERKEKSKRNDGDRNNEDKVEDEEEKEDHKGDEISEKQRTDDEAKKARILSSVDELKDRHAKEQRTISEKVKEEELFREERDHDRYPTEEDDDKYSSHSRSKWKNAPITDFEYENNDLISDKYRIEPYKSAITTTTLRTTTTTRKPIRTTRGNDIKKTTERSRKLSFFRNPQLYMVNDDEELTTTVRTINTKKPKRFSARYSVSPSTLPKDESNVRISLVPQDMDLKDGEPTLFFPKIFKNKRKSKITTTPEPHTSIEDTTDSTHASYGTSDSDTDTSSSASDPFTSVSNTAPSASETISSVDTASSALTSATSESDTASSGSDTAPSASDTTSPEPYTSDYTHITSNKEEEKKAKDYHGENGGGRKHHTEHEEEHEEHGKKAYKGIHKETKTKKGHHDKETHEGEYDDHGGIDKKHHEEDGHYGVHKHEERGKKVAKYEESGKHSKGHSTKGSHDIHKKDEYEKKVEFFEEEGDTAEEEDSGGHSSEKRHSSAESFKNANLHGGHMGYEKGETGGFRKNGHDHYTKGYQSSAGHHGHGKLAHHHYKKDDKDSGKKWIYHHGHPAKTANLVVIDRRVDGYQHGPRYFG